MCVADIAHNYAVSIDDPECVELLDQEMVGNDFGNDRGWTKPLPPRVKAQASPQQQACTMEQAMRDPTRGQSQWPLKPKQAIIWRRRQ